MSYEECACVGGCGNCEQLDYAAITGDIARTERTRILTFLEEERRIANEILAKQDCSSDCYKCDLIGGATLGLVDRLTTFLSGEDNES